jgi:hypothetical protein
MSLNVKISEKEILGKPNDAELGSYVRNKYLTLKKINEENNVLDMGQIPDYNEYDKCIVCGEESPYKVSTSVDMRHGYIEGAGQLCSKCIKK